MKLTLLLLLSALAFLACTNQQATEKDDMVAHVAWELRMDGMADSAKVILENSLAEDSTNAMAWFELTRTLQHLGLSNPREFIQNYDKVVNSSGYAVEYEPANAYSLSYRGSVESVNMYMGLQMGKEDISEDLAKIEATYMDVLALDPDYLEVKLSLLEFYSQLPSEMGGDSLKAVKYATELEAAGILMGAKAKELMMDPEEDYIVFWEGINNELPSNADVLEELGKAYLYSDNLAEAEKYFLEAMSLDSCKNTLYAVMGRYQMMQAMRNPAVIDSMAPLVEIEFDKYLASQPMPPKPVQAWMYGNLAQFKFRSGDQEGGQNLTDKAKALDPFFSKASGVPDMALFSPPDVVVRGKSYYFRPY